MVPGNKEVIWSGFVLDVLFRSLACSQHHVVVEDFSSIQGLDTLWEAFLRSRNPAVVADAGDLLVQLHLRLAVQADEPRVWDR